MGVYGEGHVKRLEEDAGLGYRRDSTFLQEAMLIALQMLFLDGRKQEYAEALDLLWHRPSSRCAPFLTKWLV